MSMITRRHLMKTAGAAGLALPGLSRSGFAAEPLKVGFVYLGAIGDYGWTWSHEQGRKALDAALKGQVVTSYVENVKEDASAVPVMKDLAQQGNKLIFTTSYGYMDQTLEAAKQFPDVRWEHCTGYKRTDNVGTYNSRFYQGRAVTGTIAGMMSKSGVIGFVGSFKIPEVVMGVNAFTLAAQAVNPKITTKLVMIDTWFDPAKEAAAAETLANLGCDVIAQHVDSPAVLQVCEKRKIYGFGYGADMSRFAPKAHLTASSTSGVPIISNAPGRCSTARGKLMTSGGDSRKGSSAWRPTARPCRKTCAPPPTKSSPRPRPELMRSSLAPSPIRPARNGSPRASAWPTRTSW